MGDLRSTTAPGSPTESQRSALAAIGSECSPVEGAENQRARLRSIEDPCPLISPTESERSALAAIGSECSPVESAEHQYSPLWPTESERLRAEAPDAVPGPAAALRLLGSARPADVADALGALSPDQLAEAVAAVALPLAPAVVTQISRQIPARAHRMLARRLVEQPELVPQRPLGLEAYLRTLTEIEAADYWNGAVDRLRTPVLEALSGGAMTAEEVVEHTRPAALTLALAACTPADRLRPWLRRATGDIRVLIARRLTEELGEDYDRWAAAITGCGTSWGTLAQLLRSEGNSSRVHFYSRGSRSDYAPENMLLALAPPAIAARYLRELGRPPQVWLRWEWLLSSAPLCRPLIDHVMAYGTDEQRSWLIRNELCPDSVLELPGHAAEILGRRVTPAAIGNRAFRSPPDERGLRQAWVRVRLWSRGPTGSAHRDKVIDLAWSLTDVPSLLHDLVATLLFHGDLPMLTCLYGALAEAVGPEPVWALELQRAGTLANAMPQVRASMAACSADPLIEAARQTPRRHWIDALDPPLVGCQLLRTEAEPDRVGHLPLEALVAGQLDGRPERWRAVVRRLAAGAGPVESVIAEVTEAASTSWTLHDPTGRAD